MTSPGGGKSGGGKSTTIGKAVLEIIPSLRGVSDAIEQQIDGKVVEVKVTPKVDPKAADTAGQQTREAVEKHTRDVKVEPKVDTRAAEQAGKATGDAITKGANDAVRKGDIGKTVSDEVTETVQKSSPGKDLAKIIVDGLASGAKDELRGGPLGDVLVDGLAEGVKQGIDRGSIGRTTLDAISRGMKSGNPAGAIRDAILPGIKQVGTDIRTGATGWSKGVADALRGGDIQGATDNIGNKVRTTTDLIANIGSTFGLQLDGVRDFGNGSATTLETVGGNVQDILTKASDMKSSFVDTGELLGNVLPGRAGSGVKSILNSLGSIIPVAGAVYDALDKITAKWHADQEERFWERNEADRRAQDLGVKPPQPGVGDFGGAPRAAPLPPPVAPGLQSSVSAGQLPGFSMGPNGTIIDNRTGQPVTIPKGVIPGSYDSGGYTGSRPVDQVAGVVHGDEYVVQATSQRAIEKSWPGALDYMNKTGRLPGYAGGGLVAGTAELRNIIGERFGISNIGGYRPGGDGFNEHSTGRALDVMVGDKSKGDAVKEFALANADAIDLKWVIWRQHLYYPGGGGYDMPDRGSPTQNHMDHVHIFSGPGIAAGLLGALKGGNKSAAAVAGPGAIDPASTDQTGSTGASVLSSLGLGGGSGTASAAGAAPVGSSSSGGGSGGGFSLPSSLTGLSTLGIDSLPNPTDGLPDTLPDGSKNPWKQESAGMFADAASAAVSGQLGSALGVLGIPDAPQWLGGISKFVSGIKIGGGDGGFGSAAPAAASKAIGGLGQPASAAGIMPGGASGQPGRPGPTYNIQTAKVEDAFLEARRLEDERALAKLSSRG